MMEINAEMVRELREKSGAGIMDCKRALAESAGDLDQAIDFLRREGMIKAGKKAGRSADEGLIALSFSRDGSRASLVEINCETDFVARTDQFQSFAQSLGRVVAEEFPEELSSLMAKKLESGNVEEDLKALIAKLGENLLIRRFAVVKAGAGERIGSYLHAGSKIGVLVKIKGDRVDAETSRDLAMHVAAMHPTYLDRRSIPETLLAKEREIIKGSPEVAGKPPAIVEKIVEGKLTRFFSDVCFLDQPFVKDTSGKKSVGSYLKEKDPGAVVLEMIRYQVGA